ncbi:MAG: PD-(D/E)XK nuclease family protein, partial [Candidatus Marinimicrobia bacterium]|nr:PD-(D/E)XK nuclease family protein [Candidatus Neomarinimicrobiota bacterium]
TTSERGRWILGNHQEATSELALNGMVEGQLVRATIDRTFIDSEGVRWIIDYKTSRPIPEEEQDEFMNGETERYRQQLQLYAVLFRQLEENRSLRTALYFPMFDGWIEQTGLLPVC